MLGIVGLICLTACVLGGMVWEGWRYSVDGRRARLEDRIVTDLQQQLAHCQTHINALIKAERIRDQRDRAQSR